MLQWRLLIAVFAGGLIWSSAAGADQAFEIVQLVCAPDTKYFSADRHYVDDLGPNGRPQRSQFFAVVWPESLETQSFDCVWGDHRIEVRAFKVDVLNPHGPCPPVDGDSVEITLDGQHVDCLEGASNSKFDSHRASLTLVEDGLPPDVGDFVLEHCSADMQPSDKGYNYRCVANVIRKK